MKKRNAYISDRLIYSSERLKSHQEQLAPAGELEEAPAPEQQQPAEQSIPAPPKANPIERKHFEEYSRVRREQLLRLSEFSALLEAELTDCNQIAAEAEKLQILFDQFFQELSGLPETLDDINREPEKFPEYNRHLEQARLVIVRHAAAVRKLLSYDTESKRGNNSVIHEIASLSFLQLFRLGFGLALPIFLGILLGAAIIGATIIMTMGGI